MKANTLLSCFHAAHLELFSAVIKTAEDLGQRVYLVGGFVRDLVRGVDCLDADVDFLVEGDAIKCAEKLLARFPGELKKFPDFFTAKLLLASGIDGLTELDFASTRKERYPKPGSLPVVELSDIQGDLSRRDFSVNAMAVRLNDICSMIESQSATKLSGLVLDPFEGREDLEHKKVRALHAQSFVDDPTRIFRAARYVTRLKGDLEKETAQWIEDAVKGGALSTISHQRVLNELKKILHEGDFAPAFELLWEWGVASKLELLKPLPSKEFSEHLLQLQALQICDQRLIEELGFALIFDGLGAKEGEAIMRLYGFGKSSFKRWNNALQGARSSEGEKELESDALALRGILISDSRVQCVAELRARKVCHG